MTFITMLRNEDADDEDMATVIVIVCRRSQYGYWLLQ